jgi:hypothetical protein
VIPDLSRFFETTDTLLRAPSRLLERISANDRLEELPLQLVLVASAGFAVFGFVLGLSRALVPGLVSSVKLGLVGLGALAICIPALHVYGRVLGSGASPLQTVCEALTALATSGMTLLALTPAWLVFTYFAGQSPAGYRVTMLGSVVALGLAGVRGMLVLMQAAETKGRRVVHLAVWTALYGLVGLQLAWISRPFVGAPDGGDDFVLVRPLERTAFDAVTRLVSVNGRALLGRDARDLAGLPIEPSPEGVFERPRQLRTWGE